MIPYPPLLELGVDKLRMVSVKRVPNHKYLQNYQNAQFLEPYKPDMDEEAWELIGSEVSSIQKDEHSVENENDIEIIGSHTAVEQLEQHCQDTLSKPPKYTQNIQIATDGSEIYITVVSHEGEAKIHGIGSATNPEQSKTLAAKDAINALTELLNNDHGPYGNIISQEEPEDEGDKTPKSNNKTSETQETQGKEKDGEQPLDQQEKVTEASEQQKSNTIKEELTSETILKVMKENFSSTLEESLKDMTDSLKRIGQTIVNDVITIKPNTEVQNMVNTKVEATTKRDIADKVKEEITGKVTSTMENAVIANVRKRVETMANDMILAAYNDKIKPMMETDTNAATKRVKDKSKELSRISKNLHEARAKQYNKKFEDMDTKQKELLKGLQGAYDNYHKDLSDNLSEHMETLEESTGKCIQNIEDVTSNLVQNVLAGASEVAKDILTTYKVGDEVQYVDEYTSTTCHIKIKQVHTKDNQVQNYTITFENGKQKKVYPIEVRSNGQESPYEVLTSKRFPNVHLESLGTKSPQQPSYPMNPTRSQYSPPKQTDIVQFHKQFKVPLRNDEDIINFYNQLNSQRRSYNILLIELDEINA